jgi:hypothetical protein
MHRRRGEVGSQPERHISLGRRSLTPWAAGAGHVLSIAAASGTRLLDIDAVLAVHGCGARHYVRSTRMATTARTARQARFC